MVTAVENLMTIGQFAEASRLSQKALRLYGENGLLAPAWVDPDSGYRYYRAEQLQAATLIAFLRRAGMPLAEIRAFLREPTVERLDEYERRAVDEFADQRRLLRYVKRILKEEPMYDVLTKRVDEQPYVSRSSRVYVRDLEPFIVNTFAELGDRDAAAPPFVLYHGPVNHEEDGPVEVCVPKAEAISVCPRARSPLRGFAATSATFRRSSARTRPSTDGRRSTGATWTVRRGRST